MIFLFFQKTSIKYLEVFKGGVLAISRPTAAGPFCELHKFLPCISSGAIKKNSTQNPDPGTKPASDSQRCYPDTHGTPRKSEWKSVSAPVFRSYEAFSHSESRWIGPISWTPRYSSSRPDKGEDARSAQSWAVPGISNSVLSHSGTPGNRAWTIDYPARRALCGSSQFSKCW